MIIRLFFEGGTFFMSLVLSMWIIVFILAIRFIILYSTNKSFQKLKRTNNSILFFGSLAFLIGITGQMIGLMAALDAIQMSGDLKMNPRYIAGGFKVTFIVTFFGMALLMLSSIFWFVFRGLKRYPTQTEITIQQE